MLLLSAFFFLTSIAPAQITVSPATRGGDFARPFDATPDPDGNTFFFTAIGPAGAGVFRVPATGGNAVQLAAGAPFVAPEGISSSSDGAVLFVADPMAYAGPGRLGQLFAVAVSTGMVRPIPGAAGLRPRAVQVASDQVYFTGITAAGQPAIYRLPATGSAEPEVIFEGAPLVEPDGLAITRSGAIYVADRAGAVYRIDSGSAAVIVERIRAGDPAGIALSSDESTLFVSTLQPYRNRAQVLIVNTATLDLSTATAVVGENAGAGGLHRAHNRELMAWCGIVGGSGGEGIVYQVRR